MKGRPVLVQAAVAAGALALAAAVWLRPPRQGAPGEVPVAALGRGEVRGGARDDGSHQVDVTRVVDSDRRAVWVRIATSPTLQAPDGGARADGGVVPDAGHVPPRSDAGVRGRADAGVSDALRAIREAPPPPPRKSPGNDVAEQLLDCLSPPMATLTSARSRRNESASSASKPRPSDSAWRPGETSPPGPHPRVRGGDAARRGRGVPARPRRAPLAGPGVAGPGPLRRVEAASWTGGSTPSAPTAGRAAAPARRPHPRVRRPRRRARPASPPQRTPTTRAPRPRPGRTASGGCSRWRSWDAARRPARARRPSRSGWSTAGTAARSGFLEVGSRRERVVRALRAHRRLGAAPAGAATLREAGGAPRGRGALHPSLIPRIRNSSNWRQGRRFTPPAYLVLPQAAILVALWNGRKDDGGVFSGSARPVSTASSG